MCAFLSDLSQRFPNNFFFHVEIGFLRLGGGSSSMNPGLLIAAHCYVQLAGSFVKSIPPLARLLLCL